jgi:hypothetical protein
MCIVILDNIYYLPLLLEELTLVILRLLALILIFLSLLLLSLLSIKTLRLNLSDDFFFIKHHKSALFYLNLCIKLIEKNLKLKYLLGDVSLGSTVKCELGCKYCISFL